MSKRQQKATKKQNKKTTKKKSDNTVNEGGDWRETVQPQGSIPSNLIGAARYLAAVQNLL